MCEYLGLGSSLKEARKDYDYVFGAHDELEELISFDIFLTKHQRKQDDSTPSSHPVTVPKQPPSAPPPKQPPSAPPVPPARKVTFTPLPTPKSVAKTPAVAEPPASGGTGVGGPVAPTFNVVGTVPRQKKH